MTTSKELPGSVWIDKEAAISMQLEVSNGQAEIYSPAMFCLRSTLVEYFPNQLEYVLIDRIQKLVEALEFYSKRINEYSHAENAVSDRDFDDGSKAREALAEFRNVRGEGL